MAWLDIGFSLFEGRLDCIQKNIVLTQLLPEVLFLLLEFISLLHVVHEFLHIHLKRESIISVQSSEEI